MLTIEFKRILDKWNEINDEHFWYEDEDEYITVESVHGTLAYIDKRNHRQFSTTYDAWNELDQYSSDFIYNTILAYANTPVDKRIAIIKAERDKDKINISVELDNDNPNMNTETINWLMEDIRNVLTDEYSCIIDEEYY